MRVLPSPVKMGETEDLIAAVETYPCLWHTNDANYCNKVEREHTWKEICKKLHTNYDSLSGANKKELSDNKKRQWNNVRDGYRKYLNRIKNNSPDSGSKMKKYIYADNLNFLTEVLQNIKPREGNYHKCYSESQDENVDAEQNAEENEKEPPPLVKEETKTTQKKKTKTESRTIQRQVLSLIKRKTKDVYQDEDSQFLLSFRNDVKLMTKSQKLQFKLGMVQLMQSITDTHGSNSSSSSSRSYSYPTEVVYKCSPSPSPTHDEVNT